MMQNAKRSTVGLGVLLTALAGLSSAAFAVIGDVNNDAVIDANDSALVLDAVVGNTTLSAQQRADADVDDTGTVTAADAQLIKEFVDGTLAAFPTRLPYQSGPVSVSRDGALVGVVNPDNDSVSFVETLGNTVVAEVAVGREPASIAFSRDGATAYVTNGRDRSVTRIDTATMLALGTIDVGVEPFGIVIGNRGDKAYVANMMSPSVSVIDLATNTVEASVSVPEKPQGLALSANSDKLYVTHLNGRFISVIDTQALSVNAIPLADIPFNPQSVTDPAGSPNRMKGVAINPATDEAWFPHLLSNHLNVVETAFNTSIFPAITVVDTVTDSVLPAANMTLFDGFSTVVAAPEAVAFSLDGALAYVVASESDDLIVFNVATRQQVGLLRDVGDNPRGIAIAPDGNTAYVFNRLSPVMSVVDLGSETVVASVATAPNLLAPDVDNGRRLFITSASPQTAGNRFMSCESCHFDGREDGRTWLFSNGPRQTQTIAGDSTRSGLMHHNGDRANLQDFAIAFTGLQGGTGLTPAQLDDMALWANFGIRFLDNPNIELDGAMNAQARQGRRVFAAAGCAGCHSGPFLTDADGNNDISNPLLHDVGTFSVGTGTQDATDRTRDQPGIAGGTLRPAGFFESSFLLGLASSAPYLHAGTADTLLDTLTASNNPADQHGVTSTLSNLELEQLAAYLAALDIRNTRIKLRVPADDAPVADITEVSGEVLANVTTVDVFINGAGPIAANVADGRFSAAIPPALLPQVTDGTRFDVTAIATTTEGDPGRDDVEVVANFGAAANVANSEIRAEPALIAADGAATSTIIVTPRAGDGSLVGSGLVVAVQTDRGSIAAAVDRGDGTYAATLTSGMSAGIANLTANVVGGPAFSATAQVQFAAGDVDPGTSFVGLDLLSLEADGIGSAQITVIPRDAFGNTIGSGQNVQIGVNLGAISSVFDRGDGTYSAIYTAAVSQGTATVEAIVNGVLLNLTPQISLVPDVTAPPAANAGAISFGSLVDGLSTVSGGAGAVEAFATVRIENVATGLFVLATAGADGSFSAQLAVDVNESVSIRVDDSAGNMSSLVELVPFVLDIASISGIVQTAASGGGFVPQAGTTAALFVIDLSAAPTLQLIPLGTVPSVVTGADGRFEILLPDGFVPDANLGVATGPDANMDGFLDAFEHYGFVNDINADVTIDAISTFVVNAIANNGALLSQTQQPASHFTAAERLGIDATLRAAAADQNLFGLDANGVFNALVLDVFFDLTPDALDTTARDTFASAADSPGDAAPPVTVTGRLSVPIAGGDVALSNVTVQMGTLAFENPPQCNFDVCVTLLPGTVATTDSNGEYSLDVPAFVDEGTPSVIVAVGDLNYNGVGQPGAFTSGGSLFSLGGFYLGQTEPMDIDLPGRAAMNLIELQGVPIDNFNATEMRELLALLRAKMPTLNIVYANNSLAQVLGQAVNAFAADGEVAALLSDIADPQQNSDTTIVTALPTMLDADGVSQSIVTIEPRDEFAQQVGPGRIVEMTTTLGQITTPAIDNGNGFYTAILTAPTSAGQATVTAAIEGVVFDQQPVVNFVADVIAPQAPDAGQVIFLNVGSSATVIGLAGAVEPLSTVTIENVTQGVTIEVQARADGSFRADIVAAQGDQLRLRAVDAAGNQSSQTNATVDAGLSLPAIANPAALPAGVTPALQPMDAAQLALAPPAGYTFLAAATLDLDGELASAPLSVLLAGPPTTADNDDIVLAELVSVPGGHEWRVLAAARAAAGILLPQSDAAFPGVVRDATLVYLQAPTPLSYVHGNVSGSRGPRRDARVTLTDAPFVDYTRDDGGYLLAGALAGGANVTASVDVETWRHIGADTVNVLLPFAGAITRRDFSLNNRPQRVFGTVSREFIEPTAETRDVFINPNGRFAYMMQNNIGDLRVIDTATMDGLSTIDESRQIDGLAFTPNASEAFVVAFGLLREFDARNESLGLEFNDLAQPTAVAVTADGELAVVASNDGGNGSVFFVDTFSNEIDGAAVAVDPNPSAVAVSRDGSRAYVVSGSLGTMAVIDIAARSVIDSVIVGVNPVDVAVTLDNSEVLVVDRTANTLIVLDRALCEDGTPGNEILASIDVGRSPEALALHPDGVRALVAESLDDTISVIDVPSRSVVDVWAVGEQATDIAIHPDGTRAYAISSLGQRGLMELSFANADTVAPDIVDIGPRDRRTFVLQDSPVEVVFSEPVDGTTIDAASILITNESGQPLSGQFTLEGGGVAAVFSADERFVLNSQVNVQVTTAVTDLAGNSLGSAGNISIATPAMQLPNLTLVTVDITENGVIATGQPGAVEPNSTVVVTNLTSAAQFRSPAAGDGSFTLSLVGLDTDGYELVTELFGGRAATDALPLPVNFTLQFPDPQLISYAPGPAGTLQLVGAPGAVDTKTSAIVVRNVTTQASFQSADINADGSFALPLFAANGEQLDISATVLGSVVLEPVALASPNFAPTQLDFMSPRGFLFGDPIEVVVVGGTFGNNVDDILVTASGQTFTGGQLALDTVTETGREAIILTLPAATRSGLLTVTYLGQTSNSLAFTAELPPNTDPIGVGVTDTSVGGDASAVLGFPDGSYLDLGESGFVVLELGTAVRNGVGADLRIFENTSDEASCYLVEAAASAQGPFVSLGEHCGTRAVELVGDDIVRYVRITDLGDGAPAAQIDAVQVLNIKFTIQINELDAQGRPVRVLKQVSSGPDRAITVTPSATDDKLCTGDSKNYSVTVAPAPAPQQYYGPNCTETITWSVSGPGTVSPTNGNSTTFTGDMMMSGQATVNINVTRSGGSSCSDSGSASIAIDVIGIDKLEADMGDEFDDMDGDDNTKTYVVPVDAMAGGNVTVTATPNPNVAEADLPACWSLTGGTGAGKLDRTVSKMAPMTTTITATAGTSQKVTKVVVAQAMFSEDMAQKYGYDDIVDPMLHKKSVRSGDSDTVNIMIMPAAEADHVFFKSQSTGQATVSPMQATATATQMVTITGVAKGDSDIEANAAEENGDTLDEIEAKVYDIDNKTLALIPIIEENDDTQTIPLGQGQPNTEAIRAGGNGFIDAAAAGDDVLGGADNALCVQQGANGNADSTLSGDDRFSFLGFGDDILTGPNGICESTAGGDDVQVMPVGTGTVLFTGANGINNSSAAGDDTTVIPTGQGEPNQECINDGPNAFLDTPPRVGSDDQLTASGLFTTTENIDSGADGVCDTSANDIDGDGVVDGNISYPTMSAAGLQTYMNNTVYQQAVASWTVTTLPAVTVNFDTNRNTRTDIGTAATAWFSSEMNDIVAAAGDSSYDFNLFMVGQMQLTLPTGTVVLGGIHPYNQPYGYLNLGVCTADLNQVASHELGHGHDLLHNSDAPMVPLIGGDANNLMHPNCGPGRVRLRSVQWDDVNRQ